MKEKQTFVNSLFHNDFTMIFSHVFHHMYYFKCPILYPILKCAHILKQQDFYSQKSTKKFKSTHLSIYLDLLIHSIVWTECLYSNILCDAQHITCLYHRNKVVGTTILQYSSESFFFTRDCALGQY